MHVCMLFKCALHVCPLCLAFHMLAGDLTYFTDHLSPQLLDGAFRDGIKIR